MYLREPCFRLGAANRAEVVPGIGSLNISDGVSKTILSIVRF